MEPRRAVSNFTYERRLHEDVTVLKLYVYLGFSHPRDFDTRRTTIRVRVRVKIAGMASRKEIFP